MSGSSSTSMTERGTGPLHPTRRPEPSAVALRHLPAGRLGATTYVVPALVVVMSWVLLGEVPPWGALVGGALCLAGVAIARRR